MHPKWLCDYHLSLPLAFALGRTRNSYVQPATSEQRDTTSWSWGLSGKRTSISPNAMSPPLHITTLLWARFIALPETYWTFIEPTFVVIGEVTVHFWNPWRWPSKSPASTTVCTSARRAAVLVQLKTIIQVQAHDNSSVQIVGATHILRA